MWWLEDTNFVLKTIFYHSKIYIFPPLCNTLYLITFESQGNSFFHGVRFSVHTSSLGNAACLNSKLFVPEAEATPSLLKESLGLDVVLLSMKFSDAQNWPDSAWVKPDQFSSTLKDIICLVKEYGTKKCDLIGYQTLHDLSSVV